MSQFLTTCIFLVVILSLCPSKTVAFGAGDIPDFAYLNGEHNAYPNYPKIVPSNMSIGKAFRHGDIEDILTQLVKTAGYAAVGGAGLLSVTHSFLGKGSQKFSKEDVKRVYFVS